MRGYNWESGGNTVNNYVNITNIHSYGHGYGHCSKSHHVYRHGGKWRKHGRKPRLYGFCSSCGFIDEGVAARMSSEQLAGESVKVIGYAADGLYSNVCNMVGGVR